MEFVISACRYIIVFIIIFSPLNLNAEDFININLKNKVAEEKYIVAQSTKDHKMDKKTGKYYVYGPLQVNNVDADCLKICDFDEDGTITLWTSYSPEAKERAIAEGCGSEGLYSPKYRDYAYGGGNEYFCYCKKCNSDGSLRPESISTSNDADDLEKERKRLEEERRELEYMRIQIEKEKIEAERKRIEALQEEQLKPSYIKIIHKGKSTNALSVLIATRFMNYYYIDGKKMFHEGCENRATKTFKVEPGEHNIKLVASPSGLGGILDDTDVAEKTYTVKEGQTLECHCHCEAKHSSASFYCK